MWHGQDTHTANTCERFLERFLIDPADMPAEISALAAAKGRTPVYVVGLALWDVFSANHTVIDANGTAYDLGSWRGSAGFLADCIDRKYAGPRGHDYLDFYMGSMLEFDDDQMLPVYEWIFTGLKEAGCDWIYSFPRLYLFDLGGPDDAESEMRDPSEAVASELERARREQETSALVDELERIHQESVAKARDEPLPPVVAAYRKVFGALPSGWPHPET